MKGLGSNNSGGSISWMGEKIMTKGPHGLSKKVEVGQCLWERNEDVDVRNILEVESTGFGHS